MHITHAISLLGLEKGECTEENLRKAKSMVPKSLEKYVERTCSFFVLCVSYKYLGFGISPVF